MARLQELTMTRGNRLLLALALAAGLVAAVLVFVALQGDGDGATVSSGGGTVSVVVAAQDISAGTEISSDMLRVIELPEDLLVAGTAEDTELVVGQTARVKILAGEQVATSKVGAENETEGLSGVVPLGMRGFSVDVEEVRAVGGLLRPGTRVDVWVALVIENDPDTEDDDVVTSRLVLQDIEVLSVAQEAQEPAPATVQEEATNQVPTSGQLPNEVDEQPRAGSVTLAVTPAQAGILVCAQEHSRERVWLALRAFGEPRVAADQTTVFDMCNLPFIVDQS
jgi:pilus assembly protein CpaB